MLNKILIIMLTVFFAMSAQAQNGATNGTLMVVKGEITVKNKDGVAEKAKIGKKVFPGDSIAAGKDSRAKIVMSDKNVINISPESEFVIEKYENDGTNKQVSLNVKFGKVRASVEQKYDGEKNQFNIKTPTAVAGVRGTDFLTSFDVKSQSTSIVTFSGVVAVGTPGPKGQIMNPVFVNPGQMTSNKKGEAPSAPIVVPTNQLQNLNQDSADNAKPVSKEPQPASGADKKETEKKPVDTVQNQDKNETPKREPASIPASSSMVDVKDVEVGAVAKDISGQLGTAPRPTTFLPPPIVTAPLNPVNSVIKDQIQSGRANVNIRLVPK